jgi:hypothetical protein
VGILVGDAEVGELLAGASDTGRYVMGDTSGGDGLASIVSTRHGSYPEQIASLPFQHESTSTTLPREIA